MKTSNREKYPQVVSKSAAHMKHATHQTDYSRDALIVRGFPLGFSLCGLRVLRPEKEQQPHRTGIRDGEPPATADRPFSGCARSLRIQNS